jgi:signal transduction histidine kinase
MRSYFTKRWLLFLAVLILPTLAIIVQGRIIASRDQEIAGSRARERVQEIRRRVAAEVGQDMFALLERIKGQEVANATVVIPQPGSYSDPAVVLVGRINNGRELLWPRDAYSLADAHRELMQDPQFAQKAEEARRAEVGRNYSRASELYRRLMDDSYTNGQQAYARLGYARALRQSGATPDAVAMYRKVLQTRTDVVDEHNVPFSSLAATELTKMQVAANDVLARVQQDVESREAMAQAHADRWEAILKTLQATSSASTGGRAGALLLQLSKRSSELRGLKDQPGVRALQRQFPALSLSPTTWQPFLTADKELWLVGRAATRSLPSPPSPLRRSGVDGAVLARSLMDVILPLVVVVRAESIRESVAARRSSAGPTQRFNIGVDLAGEPLGDEHLPGLRIVFPDLEAEVSSAVGLQRSFYGWSLLFVVPLTFLGGYLFWRDSRREVRMAGLRSQFVSSVSHELRTPLTAIRMYAEALQMKYSSDAKLHQEYLDTIVLESERLTRLLDNVLDFSRIDRGLKSYRMEPTRLADVVRSAVRTMQYPLEQHGFTLDLSIDDELPAVAADSDAIQQALLNLLANAMKFSGSSREIGLQLLADNGCAVIRVVDHGIGIHAPEQRRIFDAFYRSAVPENQGIAGTGLGLALVAHVAEAHGGSVHVESVPGEGSTFSIRLPLQPGDHS